MDHIVDMLVGSGLSGLAAKIKHITKEDAMKDYEKLRETKCSAINQKSSVGNNAMNYFFFSKRLKTKIRNTTFSEFIHSNEWKRPYRLKFIKKVMAQGLPLIKAQYAAFTLYVGSVAAFKPLIARALFCKYNPTTILDPSAGWGGRCLGAMSLDKNYIGFDTNTNLKKPYEEMIDFYPTKSRVSIHFEDSSKADFSKYDYDMVFTSPPYYKTTRPTEAYEEMPEYKNRDDFNERFFFPMVRNSYKHLKTGGTYSLNIPIDMYDDIKKILGKYDQRFQLQIAKRGKREKRFGGEYKEYIYIWKKTGQLKGGKAISDTNTLTPVQKVEDVFVKRDDMFEYNHQKGGKVRSALYLMKKHKADGYTTAGNRNSPQINIVSSIGKQLHKPVIGFTSTGELGPEVKQAQSKGATIKQVKPGYENVIAARAREAAESKGYFYIPFGMDTEEVHHLVSNQVKNVPKQVKRIVVPLGSGSTFIGIIKGVKEYRPDIKVVGVRVGANPMRKLKKYVPDWKKYAQIVRAKGAYSDPVPDDKAKIGDIALDPFYEAKALPFLKSGDLLWIVGVRETRGEGGNCKWFINE